LKSGPFNLGDPDDYRVPDRGIRPRSNAAWFATAALVVEIVAPDDETRVKVAFYAAHDVGEIVIADPMNRSLRVDGAGGRDVSACRLQHPPRSRRRRDRGGDRLATD
jgi:Uma2 family endonuclease